MKTGPKPVPMSERFWRFVDKGTPDECWEWKGTLSRTGYGRIGTGGRDGAMIHAHRASYLIHKGDIGELHVLHTCDNRSCVNPSHLFLGTQADNNADRIAKGRFINKGEANPQAKLTKKDVIELRKRHEDGVPITKLSKDFGIHYQHAYRIVHRLRWTHV